VVCEECLAAKNSLHCIDASIQVLKAKIYFDRLIGIFERMVQVPYFAGPPKTKIL
jgi:hypothetical protein